MMMMGGMFGMLLFVVFCGFAFAVLSGQMSQQQNDETHKRKRKGITKSASEIAAERYAAGDISHEEYDEILDNLEDNSRTYRLQDYQ